MATGEGLGFGAHTSARMEELSSAMEDQGTHITDLPAVVLASIVARLHNPADVMSAVAACRLFLAVVPTAPLCLRVTTLSEEKHTPFRAIRTHMRGARELDLSGCFVSDDDVASLVQSLEHLERLTLENCQKLTGAAADAVAAFGPCCVSLQRCFGLPSASTGHLLTATRMRTLLLSHVDHLHIRDFARSGGSSGLRILALNNCARLDFSELLDVATLCPHLELLFLGGSFQPGRAEHEMVSSTLIRLVALLPRLRVLELTFFASEVIEAVRDHTHVWDLCEEASAQVALSEDAFGVRAAANCSDSRKRTPLHVAASRGDVGLISALLSIGAAAVGMKDASGGTALFLAAEAGYEEACEALLRGGADVLASNRAGETPLYIAALKGHSAALGIMLAHCCECGVNWLDAQVYGDGWTPLMAAAVADRRHVGEMLLEAAGFHNGAELETVTAGVLVADQADKVNGGDSETVNAEAAGVSVADQGDKRNGGQSETANAGVSVADQAAKLNGGEPETVIAEFLVEERNGGESETVTAGVSVTDQSDKVNGGGSETVNAEAAGVSVADQASGIGSEPQAAGVSVADQGDRRNGGVSVADEAAKLNGGEPETVNAEFLVDKRKGGEDAESTTSAQLRRLLNRQNRYGQTALHIAAQKGSVWFIERLLTAGASVDVPNAYGFCAMDVAKRYKQTETADILRKWESSRQQAPTSKKSSRKARRKKDKAAESSSSLQAPEQVDQKGEAESVLSILLEDAKP